MPEIDDELEEQQSDGGEDEQEFETTDGKPYADDFSNLSEARVAELRSICTAMDQRDEWARMIEVIRATLRRYFLIGQQHPEWNADAGQFQVGPSGVTLGDEDENGEEFFEEEFNIYKGFHDVFNSVFSQTAAPTRMEAANLSSESTKAAKIAEKYAEVYERFNPSKCQQSEVAKLMWTDGRVVAITEYEEDEEDCGVDEDGEPLGCEKTRFVGVLESKCPIVEDFKSWPYLKVSEEKDILMCKDENPTLASKIEATNRGQVPNNEIARMSRIAVSEGIAQVSADTLAYLITEDCWWLRPAAFRHLSLDRQIFWIGGKRTNDDGESEKVEGIFPKGCRLKFVGSVFAYAKPIPMNKQIRVMHTNPGWGNARGSKSDAIIPVQMEFNDAMGMYSEMIHKCIPHTIVNTQQESLAAITEQFSRYGEWAAMQMDNGLPLAENIFQEQQIDVPASFALWIQNLQGALPQQLANIQPAMFGGNMDDQKTAKAYQQAKDMSLGVMAIVWVPYLRFKAGIVWQAAKLAAERENTDISVAIPLKNGRTRKVSLDASILKSGAFLCKPESDQNFPESHTDKANKWIALYGTATNNPITQQIFAEPDNLDGLRDAIGLEKLVIKGAAARDKQLAEWEMMKDGDGPHQDVDAMAQADQAKANAAQQVLGPGAPPTPPTPPIMTSSVPLRLADDDIEEARTCVRILNEARTLEMLPDTPEIVEDLEIHLKAHLTRAQQRGLQIPPDLAGIVPPLVPPIPGLAAGAAAGPGAPHPGAHPAKTPGAPAAAAVPPGAMPGPIPLGGANVSVNS